jgi:hypothetical protein
MADDLAEWWRHTVSVRRWTGPGEAGGDSFAATEDVLGFYSDKTVYSNGEVVASGRFAFPSTVDYIPVQSLVTLPALFGGRTCRVVSTAVADGGGQPTPDHQVIGVL